MTFSDPGRVEMADKALFAFADVADLLGITWFLFAGTALGMFRDGKYIPWDNDIDIGILGGNEALEKLSQALALDGFTVGRDCENNDGTLNRHFWGGTEEPHPQEGGVLVDVFHTFTEEEQKYLVIFDAIAYKDRMFLVPGPIRSYLTSTYGYEWWAPDVENKVKAKYEPARTH